MEKKVIVIESVEADGTEWGISFDGPNPEAERYVKCVSKEDAFKLCALINR